MRWQVVASGVSKGKLTADLSSHDAAHEGSYGFEATVTEAFAINWHGLLSLPAFLVTDHERMCAALLTAPTRPPPREHAAVAARSLWRPPQGDCEQ